MFAIVQVLGGVGLFLLGMILLTEGLRALAADKMRATLARFTRSPFSGAVSGLTATALLQSSSVVTLAAVGFVSAGLMTFPQALGVVLGANIGTTLTGWIVALVGFKLNVGQVLLPFITVGVIMRLLGRDRIAAIGFALAGFGVIFVGIDVMREAMSGLAEVLTPERLPDPTWSGTLILAGFGALATMMTQSSSAGVAAALTALHAGAISFHQGAALVAGMNVGGTIVTATLASIGGSVGARRTGLSHAMFNLFVSAGAVLLIDPFIRFCEAAAPDLLDANAEVGLAVFHTTFNLLGVIVVLPLAKPFARLVESLVPEHPALYKSNLDLAFLEDAQMALNAVQDTVQVSFGALLRHFNALLGESTHGRRENLKELGDVLDETQTYLDRIRLALHEGPIWDRYIALLHALDHLQRLHARCEEQEHRAATARSVEEMAEECRQLTETSSWIIEHMPENVWFEADKQTAVVREQIQATVEPLREKVIARIARDEISVTEGTRLLDAIRWLDRVSRHIDKITHYLSKSVLASGR